MTNKFQGVGVALVTPFSDNGQVDHDALAKLVEYQIANGTDYLVMLGTTSEYVTLSKEEQQAVCNTIRKTNNGRLPIVIGVGGNCTAETLEALKEVTPKDADAILSVVPYYNKPTQEGIYRHYAAIAEQSPLPIILYNVPGRTAVNMTAATTLRLQRDFANIIAIKEASGNVGQVDYILRDKREDFLVISGDDNFSLTLIAMGGDGVISVSANAFPKTMSELVHAALKSDFVTARNCQKRLLEVTDLLFAEGNPAGVKAALTYKGIIRNNLRLPLVRATEPLCANIAAQIEKYGL